MAARKITANLSHQGIFADEFRRGASYTNWRPHGSGDWLLIYTTSGSGRYVTHDGFHDTVPGEVTLFHPTDSQDYSTAPDAGHWHLLWSHFVARPRWNELLQWPLRAPGLRHVLLPGGEVRERFVAAMGRAIEFSHRRLAIAPDLAGNAIEEALLWLQTARLRDPDLALDPRIRRAMDYLSMKRNTCVTLEGIASHAGLSISRLAFLFKKATGFAPLQFHENTRLQRALQLLRLTSLSIAEVSAEVGFEDPFYFSNRFRRFAGSSPSEYRKRSANASPRRTGSLTGKA